MTGRVEDVAANAIRRRILHILHVRVDDFPALAGVVGHDLAEIEPALKATDVRYVVEPDRGEAICLALKEARPHDVVLLAGKGHEKEQILADRTIPFDDAKVALSELAELGYGEER